MILVTGATGTVGSKVVRALLDKGVPFRAGVHTRPLEVDGVETRTIDFDRQGTLPPVLEGVRDVFLASYAILQEQAIVPAARDAGVERIVLLRPHRRRGVSVVLDRGRAPRGGAGCDCRSQPVRPYGRDEQRDHGVQDLIGRPPTSFAEFFRDYAPVLAKEWEIKSQNNLEELTP